PGEQGSGRRVLPDQRARLQRSLQPRRELSAPEVLRPHRGAPGRGALTPMPAADAQLETLFRHEAGRISAWLVRLLGPNRLDLIEDAVQDAFGAALAQWQYSGTPQRPAAWLAVAARNKALDRLRREARLDPLDTQDEAAAWRLGFSNPE